MQDKIERSADDIAYVGIDMSKDSLDIALYPSGKILQMANNKKGFKVLLRELNNWPVALVVVEATAKYSNGVHRFLSEAGVGVAVINPYRSRKFCDMLGQLAKTDKIDAMMLARYGEMVRPHAREPVAKHLEELKELMSARDAAVAERTALKNRSTAAQSHRLKQECIRQIKPCSDHIKRPEVAIQAVIRQDEELVRRLNIFTSIPGVGQIVATGLLAYMPELGQLTAKQAAALSGTAPMNWDSGHMRGRRRIRGGRPALRSLLYMAAIVAGVQGREPNLAATYTRLRENGKLAKILIVAVMRKLIILANTLIADNQTWQSKNA